MKLLIDTNRYTDYARGDESVKSNLRSAHQIFLPFITFGELRAGFEIGDQAGKNEGELQDFLSQPGVHPLYPDDNTTRGYAQLVARLRRQGTPIPTNDIWIAALALQFQLTLYTRDKHFDHLPEIPRI